MRRETRTAVDEPARLHPNEWSSLEVRLLDISPNGFRAECEARVLAGSPVRLEIPGIGVVQAHVIWRRGNRFGAQFDESIDMDRCDWQPLCEQVVLSRMLSDRARARAASAMAREMELKREMLDALPVAPVAAAERSPTRRAAS